VHHHEAEPRGATRFIPQTTQVEAEPRNTRFENDARQEPTDWRKWASLLGLLVCVGISAGGRFPAKALFSNSSQPAASRMPSNSTTVVERPDGSRLQVEVFGKTKGPALLMTHGWSLDGSDWDDLKPMLAERYRLITWDLPGLGKSSGPRSGDYRLEKMADDLEAVRAHVLGLEPVILVGHSIGGMIQQTYCRLHRDKLGQAVAGMILLHTTYTNPMHTNIWAPLTRTFEPVLQAMNALQIPLAGLFWLTNWQSFWNGSLHVCSRVGSFSGKQSAEQLDRSALLAAKAWPAVVARGNMAMTEFNEERSLPEAKIPVLIIAGSNDRLTVKAASDRLQSLLPNERRMDDAGGHLGFWEHPKLVGTTILEFAQHSFASQSKLDQSHSPEASPNPRPPKS
jgi:pimeloyl-ACP methyl ester carboxylesterase